MRQFAIAIAAVAIAGLTAEAPASASQLGGPVKQNGQCWKHHGVGSDHMFGSMESCPQPASTHAAPRAARQRG
jgi:hypothetical protein